MLAPGCPAAAASASGIAAAVAAAVLLAGAGAEAPGGWNSFYHLSMQMESKLPSTS